MHQCEAKTRAGRRCRKLIPDDGRFCRVHGGYSDNQTLLRAGAGALAGNLIVPGIGAAVGFVVGLATNEVNMRTKVKKRVFISFDFDNDKIVKDFLVGQAKLPDSPFEVIDHSLQEAAPEKTWVDKAKNAIAGCDLVVVMVGAKTHKASGVLKEIALARQAAKPIVQIIAYKNRNYTAVPNAGKLYAWNWENLKKLFG